MKKDIEIPVVKDVHVAIIREWNEEFLDKDWNAYILNDRKTAIEMTMVVSKGYDQDRKSSTMRHGIGDMEPKSFRKIEVVQEDVLGLNNEFFVTFYADNKLYEKRFVFEKNTVTENNLVNIQLIDKEGIFAK
ncbi:hypothetical protein DFQ03_3260 [Maribacter caenipelagi]|uniref:Phenylalanyl-tRNA synthetase subunit alpha n=1 Tax=Maribacter caenipelagi TaxID=1447781 RepID=A0A4R7CY37_9FLAO|nr:hypothetical protein [Maribacter caenipelagi]TDS12802.1 hypothetical protein DFQ03_3260 [Maribacter caenipelagi]